MENLFILNSKIFDIENLGINNKRKFLKLFPKWNEIPNISKPTNIEMKIFLKFINVDKIEDNVIEIYLELIKMKYYEKKNIIKSNIISFECLGDILKLEYSLNNFNDDKHIKIQNISIFDFTNYIYCFENIIKDTKNILNNININYKIDDIHLPLDNNKEYEVLKYYGHQFLVFLQDYKNDNYLNYNNIIEILYNYNYIKLDNKKFSLFLQNNITDFLILLKVLCKQSGSFNYFNPLILTLVFDLFLNLENSLGINPNILHIEEKISFSFKKICITGNNNHLKEHFFKYCINLAEIYYMFFKECIKFQMNFINNPVNNCYLPTFLSTIDDLLVKSIFDKPQILYLKKSNFVIEDYDIFLKNTHYITLPKLFKKRRNWELILYSLEDLILKDFKINIGISEIIYYNEKNGTIFLKPLYRPYYEYLKRSNNEEGIFLLWFYSTIFSTPKSIELGKTLGLVYGISFSDICQNFQISDYKINKVNKDLLLTLIDISRDYDSLIKSFKRDFNVQYKYKTFTLLLSILALIISLTSILQVYTGFKSLNT